VSHQANILVMGPGGYRFSDHLKLGIPLTLVVFCGRAAGAALVVATAGLSKLMMPSRRQVVRVVAGAVIGGVVAGPVGAVLGAAVGATSRRVPGSRTINYLKKTGPEKTTKRPV